MTIINSAKEYIKLQSDLIQQVIDNPADYASIKVTGNINCCTDNCGDSQSTFSIDLTGTGWRFDLDEAVKLESTLRTLNLENLVAHNLLNVITAPIDLGYVNDSCLEDTCTLEDFTIHFAPLFKAQIDDFFTSVGISSNVTVIFDGNIVIIDDLPTNFVVRYVEVGTALPYDKIYAGFGTTIAAFYFGADGLYILPSFFSMLELVDGIYKFDVKIYKTDSNTLETNCAFVDITIKCKVASVLDGIMKESKNAGIEQCSTIIHILHYALVNGSNCGCNCEELCTIFRELFALLNSTITTDCGCS